MPRGKPSRYDHHWRRVRLEILARDAWRCYKCGGFADQVDHIVPVSEAPHLRLERSNLRASCGPHNSGRTMPRLAALARINREAGTRRQW